MSGTACMPGPERDVRRGASVRTALVLAVVAVAFFVGIIVKRWLFPQ